MKDKSILDEKRVRAKPCLYPQSHQQPNSFGDAIGFGPFQADLVNPPHGSNDPAPVAGSVASGPGQFRNYTADTRYTESDPLRHGLDVKQVGSLRLKPPKISRGFFQHRQSIPVLFDPFRLRMSPLKIWLGTPGLDYQMYIGISSSTD